ncbi:MAG: hypothetical protein NTV46_06115 [Verrucomicrobia bacterium]|nr:hypothetical protein [Verrucomicrobiota bacterium]
MPAPSEPEKYSIDEMMERLQSLPPEEPVDAGELVIRADGSQAIRVRRRKRRSQQPHKETLRRVRRIRMLQISVVLILILLAAGSAGIAVVVANSAPFREKLLREIAWNSGATVETEQIRINPTSVNAGRLALSWPAGNVLRSLTLGNIRADISLTSFLGKPLHGEEMTASEGTLILRIPQADQPARNIPAIDPPPLPIRYNNYAIPKAHVLLGDPAAPFIRMANAECSFNPYGMNGRPQLLFHCGDITINGWPKLRMDRSHIEFRGTEVDIVGMHLLHETDNRGVLELAGTVYPYATDRVSILAVHLFAGRIDSRSDTKPHYLSFTPAADPGALLTISFRNSLVSPFEIKGFPFLFGLSQTFGDDWFERPVFAGDVSGVLRRMGGNATLSDISFEQPGRMAMQGTVIMAPDLKLSGNLKIGIAEAAFHSARSRLVDSMFGPPLEGFRWLTLKIGGTTAAPTDNFKDLFAAAETTKKPTPNTGIPTFEELTQPK